jgi:hypothetical protein
VPTTLTGLLLFVVLLLPGFAYLVGKERHGTERSLSPFRETVAVVAASISSELVVLGLFAAVRALWPRITPSPGALIVNGGAYAGGTPGHPGHYKLVAVWGIVLLATATLGAYLATKPKIRRVGEKLKLTGPYPHDSAVSAWWVLFERWPEGRTVEVSCTLEDGSAIRGQFGSFNNSAEDSPDRDLILLEPIFYRPPGENAKEVPYDMSAVCFPARRIVALFVIYTESARTAIPAMQQAAAVPQGQAGPGGQAQPGPAPSAASPALSAATPSSEASMQGLASAAPLPESSGPSALARLKALRFW